MNNATRIVIVASAFSALTAIACTTAPGDEASVEVQQGTVDPSCIKGGLGCAPTGGLTTTSSGGTKGGVGGFASSSGMVLDPGTSSGTSGTTTSSGGTTVPPKGYTPVGCGEYCRPKYDADGVLEGCTCSGAGFGLQSTIQCPTFAQCPRSVYGVFRCYPLRPDGTCNY